MKKMILACLLAAAPALVAAASGPAVPSFEVDLASPGWRRHR